MARQQKPENERARTLTFRGSSAEKQAVDVLAARAGVDTAEFVRTAIMAQHGAQIEAVVTALAQVVP